MLWCWEHKAETSSEDKTFKSFNPTFSSFLDLTHAQTAFGHHVEIEWIIRTTFMMIWNCQWWHRLYPLLQRANISLRPSPRIMVTFPKTMKSPSIKEKATVPAQGQNSSSSIQRSTFVASHFLLLYYLQSSYNWLLFTCKQPALSPLFTQ